jgi:SAM-dependent methyltransferase
VNEQGETRTAAAAAAADVDAATQAHFAARAATYSGGGDAALELMLELAALRPGERVLDVATGTGQVLFPLARRVGPEGLAAGVDFTPEMLAQAGRTGAGAGDGAGDGAGGGVGGRPVLVAAHAVRLPFREGTFDAVTCRYAVHHFSDPERSLAAMAAVLRPGGRLVVADFERPEEEAAGAAQDRLEALRGHVHVRIATRSQLKALLAGAGCPVVAEREAQREVRPQDLLQGPNVSSRPEQREALASLVQDLEREGGAGMRRREVEAGGEVRLVRTDAVLLGIKGAV